LPAATDIPASASLIPKHIETWIADWLKENVVTDARGIDYHNVKVVWARAAAIALYRHLQEDGIPAAARPMLDKIESIALCFADQNPKTTAATEALMKMTADRDRWKKEAESTRAIERAILEGLIHYKTALTEIAGGKAMPQWLAQNALSKKFTDETKK